MDDNNDKGHVLDVVIHHLYHPTARNFILAACAGVAILTPFTDTIYLPALSAVADAFDTTDSMVSLTVSIYLASVGIGQLIWGPLSDYCGRTRVLYVALVLYEAFTVGCIFCSNIVQLIILRSIEGFVVGSTIVSAQSIITDVFAPDERGAAMGAFLAPFLIGPVVAPIVGGALAESFGWNATFVFLAIVNIPILLLVFLGVPETHPWWVIRSVEEENAFKTGGQEVVKNILTNSDNDDVEREMQKQPSESTPTDSVDISKYDRNKAQEAVAHRGKDGRYALNVLILSPDATTTTTEVPAPVFVSPLTTLSYLFDLALTPYYLMYFLGFAIMFTSLTLLPLSLAEAPYNMSETVIGLSFLPIGLGMMAGSLLGGALADHGARYWASVREGRMVFSIVGMVLEVIGGASFGWCLGNEQSLVLVLLCHTILGIGQAVSMTACVSYLPILRPDNIGGVMAVSESFCVLIAALFIAIAPEVSSALGLANLFFILSGLFLIVSLWCSVVILSPLFRGSTEEILSEVESEVVGNAHGETP